MTIAQVATEVERTTPTFSMSVDFSKGLATPRWDLVSSKFFASASHEGVVTTVPLFHIPLGAPHFAFDIRISGARFTQKMVGQSPGALFDCRPEGKHPFVYVVDGSRQALRIEWKDTDALEGVSWGRWIMRFFVEADGANPQPMYIGFTSMSDVSRDEVLEDLAKKDVGFENGLTEPKTNGTAIPGAEAESACTLTFNVQFDSKYRPRFPDLFEQDLVARNRLPEDAYLEPMFIVKRSDVAIDFNFESSTGIFSMVESDPCNPVIDEADNLAVALHWEGVSLPKPNLKCENVALGFVGSWRGPGDDESSKNVARIRWSEPKRSEDKASVASFFFRDLKFLLKAASAGEPPGVLVDPTIVFDEEDP